MNDIELEDKLKENEGLVIYVVKKLYPYWLDNEDIIQCGRIGLWKAIVTFDENRGKFSTHAYILIRREIQKYLRANENESRLGTVYSLDAPMCTAFDDDVTTLANIIPDPNDCYLEIDYDIQVLKSKLSERDFEMFRLSLLGYSAKELGEMYSISRANASRILIRARALCKKYVGCT